MKVFISWSGNLSKNLAEIFRDWFPAVIQAVRPYYTADDITKGARWNNEISKELEDCKTGIICLTRDNLEAPWIMFEAGALSKNIDKSKVCPILFDVDPTDIQGPLVQFQAARFEKEEMRKVVKMMNAELGDRGLAPDVLNTVFEMWWPKLKEKVDTELKSAALHTKETLRSERDLLEEILQLTRSISSGSGRRSKGEPVRPRAILDLVQSYKYLVEELKSVDLNEMQKLHSAILSLKYPIRYLITTIDETPEFISELHVLFDRAVWDLRRLRSERDQETVTE